LFGGRDSYFTREDLAWFMASKSDLSQNEFTSLAEVGKGFFHDMIPAGDAARLQELGLVYNLLGSVRITTAGRDRLRLGF